MHIGLYFGSFNPIHNGHLAIAEYMYTRFSFDAIWFVVSPSNPLKQEDALLDASKRLELVEVATQDKPYLIPSDIEFQMDKPSFTCLTLRKIHADYPNNTFALLLGSDNMETITLWKNSEEILQNYTVYVYPRSEKTIPIARKNIVYTHPNLLDISSTCIRERIKNRETIAELVHPKVLEIIEREKLYR